MSKEITLVEKFGNHLERGKEEIFIEAPKLINSCEYKY